MSDELSRGGFEPRPVASGGGGGGAAAVVRVESTSPIAGSVGYAAELYLGPAGSYSYSSGGGGYLPGMVFASTIKRFTFRCAAMGIDNTVRLRTSGGTQLYSKVLTAGSTLIDEAVSIAVTPGTLVQCSIDPGGGGPTIDAWHFGWTREIAS